MNAFGWWHRLHSRYGRWIYPIVRLLAALALLAPLPAAAQSEAWQGLFARQCGGCHGTARDLLRDRADLVEGVLVGRESGQTLRIYLRRHFRERSREEIAVVHAELLRVAQGGGRFSRRCAVCHESAEALARDRLILRDGRLHGRYSGRDIANHLQSHARIAGAEEATFFEKVLRRQMAREQGN